MLIFTQSDWQLFNNINTLPQQAGVAKHLLIKLIVKELVDNALDVSNKVEVTEQENAMNEMEITIRDFGGGFEGSNEEIAHFFSVKRPLTSSKRFRLPSRGALGNGLRVVVGTVFSLNARLQLSTKGRTLELTPQDDGQTVYKEVGTYFGEGTEIKLTIPHKYQFYIDNLSWANLAIYLNKGECYQGKTSAYFYDSDSFFMLLQTAPVDYQLQDFIGYFEGITKTKIKKIIESFTHYYVQKFEREECDLLLGLLRKNSREVKASKLGKIDKLEDFAGYAIMKGDFEILTSKGNYDAKIPFIVEAFAKLDGKGDTQFFVNKTPITGTVDVYYAPKSTMIFGCGLNERIDTHKLPSSPTVWLNIITPYMPIVSNGKEPDFSAMANCISSCVRKAINQLKEKKNREDGHLFSVLKKLPSQKEVVIKHLNQAIEKASGNGKYRYSLRQLYYVLRPFVMEHTNKELKYANFNNIITDFEHQQGKDLRGVYRDERGTLLHPHSHEEIRLGTKSIEKYDRPIFNFNKILYSEKEGFFEILKEAGFCEKHDCALLTSKGFASRAARDVIDLLAETEEELLFFCIHDADISGTLIYQALQGATKARPKRKVKIINLGLEAWEGLSMQLEVEQLERRSTKRPASYVVDYDKNLENIFPFQISEKFVQNAWEEWLKSYRIELNAMDTPTFIDWLDKKVSEYDNGKVVPPKEYLENEANTVLEQTLKSKIRHEILAEIDIEALIMTRLKEISPEMQTKLLAINLEEEISKDLLKKPQQSWYESFNRILASL